MMSVSIDPREVKEHLEYLGYRNITKEQLKDFIRDLKRLIKYEQSKANKADCILQGKDDKGTSPVAVSSNSDQRFEECNLTPVNADEIDSENQRRSTYSSPRSVKASQLLPTVESCVEKSSGRTYHPNDYIDENLTYQDCYNDNCCCNNIGNSQLKNPKKKCQESQKNQPVPSFIRPGKCKPSKCDPVALYHYYQSQWSKRPLPGEDPRLDLRWSIRTKLAQQHQACQQKPTSAEFKQRKEWVF